MIAKKVKAKSKKKPQKPQKPRRKTPEKRRIFCLYCEKSFMPDKIRNHLKEKHRAYFMRHANQYLKTE